MSELSSNDTYIRTLQYSHDNKIKILEWPRSDKRQKDLCSPSSTQRIKKSFEKYDVITKVFQYHRNILEEEKINRQSHWISHNARAMLTE